MKCAIDLVCFALHQRRVAVLLESGARGTTRLPSVLLTPRESIDVAAETLARRALARKTRWREQAGAHAVDRHPLGAHVAVTVVTAAPRHSIDERAFGWYALSQLPAGLPTCHRDAIAASLEHVRARADISPTVFAMLSHEFTLSQLQQAYEALLGRALYKASFRRTIRATRLIEATSSSQSEGRGRPARLYRRTSRATPADAVAVPAAPFRAPAKRRRPRRDTTRA